MRLWESLFDIDPERAQAHFFESLQWDARANRERKAKDDEEERRLTHVLEQWQPAGTTAELTTFVLGLHSAPSMARHKAKLSEGALQ